MPLPVSAPLWQPRTDRAARLLGAGSCVLGAALLGYQLAVVRDAIAAHETRVTYFLAAFGLGELAVGLGAFWLVRGLAGYTEVRALRQNPRHGRVFAVAVALLLGGTWLALRAWLASEGYDS